MAEALVAQLPLELDMASYCHIKDTFIKSETDTLAPCHRDDSDCEAESDISNVTTHEPSTTDSDGPSRPYTPDPVTGFGVPSRSCTPDPFENPSYGLHPDLQPRTLGSTDAVGLPFRWQQALLPDMQQARLIAERLPQESMQQRSSELFELMSMRRSVAFFSSDDVPTDIIETCVATAGTCPSGLHKQPWFYAIVRSHDLKQCIRHIVEEDEEKSTYKKAAPVVKAYLTEAPLLIVAFKQTYTVATDGSQENNYWVGESCGMSVGFLQMALHSVGLATLPTRPAGAGHKIRQLLGRPENEKMFLLLPVGYPSKDATIPYREVARKPLADICAIY